MYYEELANIYSELGKTTKRLEKVDIISEFLKKVSKDELSKVIYLLQGLKKRLLICTPKVKYQN